MKISFCELLRLKLFLILRLISRFNNLVYYFYIEKGMKNIDMFLVEKLVLLYTYQSSIWGDSATAYTETTTRFVGASDNVMEHPTNLTGI